MDPTEHQRRPEPAAAWRLHVERIAESLLPRTTVDWDTSQADDIRTRGVSWMNKRQMDRGRAPRSDRKSLA
jgi:hypothetical protein